MLRGETATVHAPTVAYDPATKDELVTYTPTVVGNVLFGRPTTEQLDEAMRLFGVHAQYTLAIPKSFTASLRGCYVTRERDGENPPKYWVAGDPPPLPPEVCPTPWNREAIAGWTDG